MANTIMSAKNSFQEGLIMDFAPSNTQATCMTSALNATLLTFNGNEMSLQNDMGNARVETACLPEGYVPVGSCEFGDIIYIVSYNPLTNKSQIGCFPSPERNISTEETHNTNQIIKSSDFQEFDGRKPTGKLLTNSVKKVLINTKKLNAGDKYIIYTNPSSITQNYSKLSDCINVDEVEQYDNLPKNVKLHVVSIEDSGKITYLDSTTKWYNTEDYKYYLSSKKIGNNSNTDLDEYRNLVSSNWSIFSSKVSGKLAILAELETPETFSCSWDLQSLEPLSQNGITYKRYTLNLLPNTDSKITPKYICLTKAQFDYSKPNYVQYGEGNEYRAINSDLTREVYNYDKSVQIATITIPYKDNNGELIKSKSFIFNIDVVPAMDYGLVESLKTSLTIDFNQVGTGDIDLYTWKYHNSENTSVLTFGINAYPKPNWEVNNIVMQFFDNQGLVAEYLLNDKKSYSGLFTEYIGLNNKVSNSRISRSKSDNSIIYHKGDPIDKIIDDNIDNYTTSDCSRITEDYKGQVYLNNAGTLYSGFLYAVKIIVTQQHINDPTIKDIQVKYRWYWTNPMFNEYYYSVKDFDILNFELILNGEAMFETSQYYIWKQKELNNLNNDFNTGENYKTNSANIQYIGYGNENNLNMYIYAGLQNDYGCFNLIQAPTDEKDDISGIDLKIYLGESNINYSIPEKQYEFSVKEETPNNPTYLALNNSVNKDGEIVIATDFNTFLENPETLQNTQADDKFNIYFSEYLHGDNKQNTWDDPKVPKYVTTLDKCYFESNDNKVSIPLSMQAILFNKAYTQSNTQGNIQVPVYTPIIDSLEELNSLGIIGNINNDIVTLSFKYAVALSHAKNLFSATKLYSDNGVFNTADSDDDNWKFEGPDRLIDTATNTDFLDKIWGNINPNIDLFFPVYLGGYGNNNSYGTKYYSAISGSAKNYIPTNKWKWAVESSNNERENSKLTEGAFDIDGANIVKADSLKSVSFLGVKYKNGMTIINNAFRDSVSGDNQFNQQAISYSTYSNFAYQLYLLLTNTYHKNKRVQDQKINLKNYVRNGDYDIELVKHVIIELSAEGKQDMNITLRGVNFKDYRETILGHEDLKANLSLKNVSLKLLSFANDHELKILVKSQPMSFFNNEVEAYIKRFGMLYPVNDLSPNNFYIYQNGELIQYSNGTLIFSETDVKESLKHIFKDYVKESPTLGGTKRKTSIIIDDVDLGYNEYIDYIRNYMSLNTEESIRHSNQNVAKQTYINNMFNTLPDSLYGYSKNEFREDTINIINRILAVVQQGNFCIVRVQTNALQELLQKKTGKTDVSPNYEFITHRFLNIFDYQNEFITKSTQQLGSSFGIKDGGNDKNSAYTGFARDILLDTDYQVV